jgi:predicted TIM-barrel fold metal-dependent hydrolase
MNRSSALFLLLLLTAFFMSEAQTDPAHLLLKDYRPKPIYKIPVTTARIYDIPVIDMHAHPYATTAQELSTWVKTMDKYHIKKTIILSYSTGARFDSIYNVYSKYEDRFEVWCGFDYTGFGTSAWPQAGLKELQRCYDKGARGIGELGDKGMGELYSKPVPGRGIHIDDPGMQPLLKKCAELKMPISIHVSEPQWMYESMDSTNDGLMNAHQWKIDKRQPGLLGHDALVSTLEHAVKANPGTTFIACHFANCESDLSQIGRLLKKYPNLYADIAARFAETAPIPRAMKKFYQEHAAKLVYGTDMGMDASMYQTTFRILESADEHFYDHELFSYHWPLHGFELDKATLMSVYFKNAEKILKR